MTAPIVIESKFSGRCAYCGGLWAPGDPIARSKVTDRHFDAWLHSSCAAVVHSANAADPLAGRCSDCGESWTVLERCRDRLGRDYLRRRCEACDHTFGMVSLDSVPAWQDMPVISDHSTVEGTACPLCGAGPGVACRRPDGRPKGSSHGDRRRASIAAAKVSG